MAANNKQTFESVWELCKESLTEKRLKFGDDFGRGRIITHCLKHHNIVIGSGIAKKIVSALKEFDDKNSQDTYQSYEELQDGTINVAKRYSASEPISKDKFAELFNIDLDKNDVVDFSHSTWGSGENLRYATRGKFKPSVEKNSLVEFKKELLQEISGKAKKVKPFKYDKENSKAFHASVADLHSLKYSSEALTGDNYNTDISLSLYSGSMNYLLEKVQNEKLDRVHTVLGHDFFNIDNSANTTTRGTPQHSDMHLFEGVGRSIPVICNTLENASELAQVYVSMVSGNHDFDSVFFLGQILKAYFRNNPNITIDDGLSPRKYARWGKCLWLMTHGSDEKAADLPKIMASEAGALGLWDGATCKEIHSAHFHGKKRLSFLALKEEFGIIHRTLPAMTFAEEWHHKKGYIGNIESAIGLVYDKEHGYETEYQITAKRLLSASK